MGAMYRLKAYFGMVPAEEMGEYADEPLADRYPGARRDRSVRDYANERWDDRFAYEDDSDPVRRDRYDDEWDRRPARPAADRGQARGSVGSPVRGALAMEPDLQEPVRPTGAAPAVVPEQRDRANGASALARITTLQPRSYRDARTIGERYRSGVPVIMNLTELDAAEAKRLVDFAAGLVFALHGGFDKVTNRVFLLTPADVEVSAEDARMLAQRSVSGASDPDRGFRGE
ncbi:MAG TPA: cell division protein SepF [Pseudonocardia sp.]|jgi:cell division inhibitor SepF|uniref:cell division protein SepF n=1 Tax=Pseudonocardia sp. TaxID=60912 RepID=UPI002B4B952E|nr:cell division protein SepF [Pseudonocardia sp.]HLU59016.1 cell division protein SepF [Pseudonocardia sp.]